MAEKINLPEGMSEERFKEILEDFKRKFEGLKAPETRDEAISALAREITEGYQYWLPPAFSDEGIFTVEGEVGSLLGLIVSYLLEEDN